MTTDTTAMQELINRIDSLFLGGYDDAGLRTCKEIASKLLSKEEEQIITAYQQGMNDGEYPATIGRGIIYYENTYQP